MKVLVLVLALSLAGCASGPGLRDYDLSAASVELTDTPFFPQSKYQCGPAALATVLDASGVAVVPDELTPYIYLPEREGSLQAEIVASTRRLGRVPYELHGSFDDLLTELAAGTPVLIMQNLGLRLLPRWHYAVVIGYDAASDSILLRSGTTERLRINRIRFQGTWARADNWAMVAALPGEPPASAQSTTWLRAASEFEALGQVEPAAQAYQAATVRWPDEPLAWQALANASYGAGDLQRAEAALRHSLRLSESAAGYNNLAHILLERGCPTAAEVEINRAQAMDDAAILGDVLARTRASIAADSGENRVDCGG